MVPSWLLWQKKYFANLFSSRFLHFSDPQKCLSGHMCIGMRITHCRDVWARMWTKVILSGVNSCLLSCKVAIYLLWITFMGQTTNWYQIGVLIPVMFLFKNYQISDWLVNVNLTWIDQNDLPQIPLNTQKKRVPKQYP